MVWLLAVLVCRCHQGVRDLFWVLEAFSVLGTHGGTHNWTTGGTKWNIDQPPEYFSWLHTSPGFLGVKAMPSRACNRPRAKGFAFSLRVFSSRGRCFGKARPTRSPTRWRPGATQRSRSGAETPGFCVSQCQSFLRQRPGPLIKRWESHNLA